MKNTGFLPAWGVLISLLHSLDLQDWGNRTQVVLERLHPARFPYLGVGGCQPHAGKTYGLMCRLKSASFLLSAAGWVWLKKGFFMGGWVADKGRAL